MGICRGFWDEIKPCSSEVTITEIKDIIATDSPNPRVAIDAYLQIVSSFKACWSGMVKNGNITSFEPVIKSTIEKCVSLDRSFTKEGMRTIWCLDGDKSVRKLDTERRSKDREDTKAEMMSMYLMLCETKSGEELVDFKKKYTLLAQHIPRDFVPIPMTTDRIQDYNSKLANSYSAGHFFPPNMFNLIVAGMTSKLGADNINFLRVGSISEGEKLATILTHLGVAQAIFTTDSDTIIIGARFVIKSMSSFQKTSVTRYHLYSYARVIRYLGINHSQLLKLAILFGNDFNDMVPDEGAVNAKRNVNDPNFDITKHNINRLGCLNLNICVAEFTVSTEEYNAVIAGIEQLSKQ